MNGRLLGLVVLVWAALFSAAAAHEIRPAYLQIEETAPARYLVLWKVPATGDRALDIQPEFDPGLVLSPIGAPTLLDGFAIWRFALTDPGGPSGRGLPGTRVSVPRLPETAVDALVSVSLLDGTRHALMLRPREASAEIPRTPSVLDVAATYTRLGVEHILLGIDHLMFVAALMLVVRGWRMLAATITAFTVAHSITLAMAALGRVSLPPPPVEALIAVSILLVAVEAVRLRRGETSLAARSPWVVAFAFGLLHGFGFACALAEIGLPQAQAAPALLFFNVGVELGQLAFVAVCLCVASALRAAVGAQAVARAPVVAAYAIGTLAAFWAIERTAAVIAG